MNDTAFVAIGAIAGGICCHRVGRLLVAQTKETQSEPPIFDNKPSSGPPNGQRRMPGLPVDLSGMVKPPFNYTGCKFKLLPELIPLFDYDRDSFVDLFTGAERLVQPGALLRPRDRQ